ncbi:flagellar hook-length control protein FliK [Rhodanobacter sp. Si-c]|uniref:Flagellar hook-length control protein FliK n=1 Tax=Rhodanobacter lycopersici TaxID=3162487 RepID=A0ABV3QI73_9GAMM
MTPPAALSPLPAAPSMRSAPAAGTPRSDATPSPFDQHLQAARSMPPADATRSADRSSPSAPDAQGESSTTDAAAKSASESNMSMPATTPAASATGTPSPSAAASRGQADAALLDAALATAQAASGATGAGDAAATPPATSKTAGTAKPGEDAAATLAGAMLALLGRVMDGMGGASSGADDATVSADGSASGQGKAAAVSQGLGMDDKTLAAAVAAAAPTANLASMPASMERLFASAGTDTRKDHGLESLALAAAPASPPTAQAPALPQLQLSSSPGSSGFADELGQQVVWLGQQDIQQAKIRLHPEDLGSLDVQLSVSHGRVDVVFSAQHPAAVTAVQQSLPQLDHMLAQHGLSLGHAEVGQQQSGGGQARGEGHAAAAVDEIGEANGTGTPVAASRIGLLDAFA